MRVNSLLTQNRKPGNIILLNLQRTVIYFFLIFLLIITLFPIYTLFIDATRSTTEIHKGVSLIPGNYILKNLETIQEKTTTGSSFFQSFLNSLFLSSTITFLSCYFSAMTAHGLHCYNFRGNRFMSISIFALMMIPPQLSMIGFMQFISSIKLLGTYIPLIIPAMASPFAIYFFMQYFKNAVSLELINAARIDGANELMIFHKVIIPLIMPGLAVNAIFSFVGSWNNFMMPYLILSGNPKKFTMPMMASHVRNGNYVQDLGAVNLALVMMVLPLLVVYALLSRYIIAGIALGGVKE